MTMRHAAVCAAAGLQECITTPDAGRYWPTEVCSTSPRPLQDSARRGEMQAGGSVWLTNPHKGDATGTFLPHPSPVTMTIEAE